MQKRRPELKPAALTVESAPPQKRAPRRDFDYWRDCAPVFEAVRKKDPDCRDLHLEPTVSPTKTIRAATRRLKAALRGEELLDRQRAAAAVFGL